MYKLIFYYNGLSTERVKAKSLSHAYKNCKYYTRDGVRWPKCKRIAVIRDDGTAVLVYVRKGNEWVKLETNKIISNPHKTGKPCSLCNFYDYLWMEFTAEDNYK